MTRRITLPLAESTTDTECGECPHLIPATLSHGLRSDPWCALNGFDLDNCLASSDEDGLHPLRAAECIAAEQADAQRSRDAALGARVRRAIAGMDPEGRPERLESIAVDYGPDYWEHDILMALAAALREEHGR